MSNGEGMKLLTGIEDASSRRFARSGCARAELLRGGEGTAGPTPRPIGGRGVAGAAQGGVVGK